jgi:hypothetical protein
VPDLGQAAFEEDRKEWHLKGLGAYTQVFDNCIVPSTHVKWPRAACKSGENVTKLTV